MSGAISGSGYTGLASILAGVNNLQSQYATLQNQVTTGEISQTYSGLPETSLALSLEEASSRNTTYSQNINMLQGQASAMQTALSQIGTLVSSMAADALSASQSGSDVNAIAQEAQQAYQQVLSLINTSYAGSYVFSGADSSNPPVPDASNATSSGMYTQIAAQVQALNTVPSTVTASDVITNTASIAASTASGTTIFSAYLTDSYPAGGLGAPSNGVQISDSQTVSLNFPANQNIIGASGTSATGSAMNDILQGLAILANSSDTTAANPDFQSLMQSVSTTLSSANSSLNDEVASLGVTQDTLTTASSTNSSIQTMLKTQLSSATQVDAATAISNLQAVNTQLETSYQVMAMAKGLNLASYL